MCGGGWARDPFLSRSPSLARSLWRVHAGNDTSSKPPAQQADGGPNPTSSCWLGPGTCFPSVCSPYRPAGSRYHPCRSPPFWAGLGQVHRISRPHAISHPTTPLLAVALLDLAHLPAAKLVEPWLRPARARDTQGRRDDSPPGRVLRGTISEPAPAAEARYRTCAIGPDQRRMGHPSIQQVLLSKVSLLLRASRPTCLEMDAGPGRGNPSGAAKPAPALAVTTFAERTQASGTGTRLSTLRILEGDARVNRRFQGRRVYPVTCLPAAKPSVWA